MAGLGTPRLYWMETLGAGQIARELDCSKATVINRLRQLKESLGTNPIALRRLSSHLAEIEQDASDSRAGHIRRRKLIYGPEEDEP